MNRRLLLFLATAIIFASCAAPRAYFPDRVNTPGLKEKGDANLAVTGKFQATDNDTTFNKFDAFAPAVDVNYAITDKIGVIASYRSILNKNMPQNTDTLVGYDDKYKGRGFDGLQYGGVVNGYRFDLGLGFFTKLGTKGLAEIYIGGGIGKLRRRGSFTPRLDYTTNYFRYFVQPAAGFYIRERFSVMWGARIAIQKYYNFRGGDPLTKHYITEPYYEYDRITTPAITDITYAFFEPFANIEAGGNVLKFNVQVGLGLRFGRNYGTDIMPGGPHLSFGLKLCDPHQLFKK